MIETRPHRVQARTHVLDCLARIEKVEPAVRAFQARDSRLAIAAAERVDSAKDRLPLAGLALGVKDIIDAAPYPTGCGTPIFAGRIPVADAAAVAQLCRAGAIVMGKTVTTELAFFSPGPTRNPHDRTRTPGGSSSGSAAAVAAGFVDAALGTQTAASITRPASFCGVVGFKPSFGTYSLDGVQGTAPSFDTLGTFAREVATVAKLHAVLASPVPRAAVKMPVLPRRIGVCRTPWWENAEQASRDAVETVAAQFGSLAEVEDVDMAAFADAAALHAEIMSFEAAQTLTAKLADNFSKISLVLRDMLDKGGRISRDEHLRNLSRAAELRRRGEALVESYDVLLAPAASGEAPVGIATGDPTFSRIWMLLGVPTVTIPSFLGPNKMPVGVQLISAVHQDERLLSHALWAEAHLPKAAAPRLADLQISTR